MKRCLLVLLLFCWQATLHATITMHIEPSQAAPGETLRLTLTINDTHSNTVPDLTPLKKDFTIIGTEHSIAYSAINGVAHSSNQWMILLTAKKSGTLTIPAIQIENEWSPPGQVTISTDNISPPDHDDKTTNESKPVFLQADLDKKTHFINEQIIYTVKLYSNQPLLNAEYQPPHVEDAVMVPLQNGRRYRTRLNDTVYDVDEQKYAIFPQKSGKLKVVSPQLTAMVYDTIPQRIRVKANAIHLNINPVPQNKTNQTWLPAKDVQLTEEYEPIIPTLTQGTTLVRRIKLDAVAMPAELLPTITLNESKQYSLYPDKPKTKNQLKEGDVVGSRILKVTYLLNQSGEITIPAITIPWFNTTTGQDSVATLPAHKLTILPNITSKASPSTLKPAPIVNAVSLKPTTPSNPQNLAWWVAGALALAWFLTLLIGWSRRVHSLNPNRAKKIALKQLRKACIKHDPAQTRTALLTWARLEWPDTTILGLNELNILIHNVELKKQIQLLSQVLYSERQDI